ncbi:hypothetical protein HELRODRAFT_179222 [Helobdella robusta]|uniref:Membrane protein BRI3 n=1 Tax=Helobdella robusta TaxID=6412 RepID=T1FED7_HELRO|nr:hypothetical protein HELRODRAFT_179222 [Helobdella robusta]ESN95454.1 hypothetical protein HELRODRAFT_179222 [Helobdella robusta]
MQPAANNTIPTGPPPAYTPTAPPSHEPPLPPYSGPTPYSYQSGQSSSTSAAPGYRMPTTGFKYNYPNYSSTTTTTNQQTTVYTSQPVPPFHQQQQRVLVTAPIVPADQSIIIVGGCPVCRIGVLQDDFTCLGVCCAIVFFPMGLLFCLLFRERRCNNCGAVFG